jgi:6-pyruvoyltetrahydropterin/6-carboxytetrahydropterin synthase
MDFAEVDEIVERCVVRPLDHRHLNDLLDNPTAERLALYAGDRLTEAGLPWTILRLWETEDGSVVLER